MFAALVVGGCTTLTSSADLIGKDQASVTQQLGYPAAVYDVDGQAYWFYNKGRQSSDRSLLIFDTNGLLIEQRPAWTREAFHKEELVGLKPMDVLHRVGPPLAQGKERRRSLLGMGGDEETAKEEDALTYWSYGFRDANQFYNAYVIFSNDNVVSDVYIQRDVVGSSDNSY